MGNIVRRHYTITNSLRKNFYSQLLEIIAPFNEINKGFEVNKTVGGNETTNSNITSFNTNKTSEVERTTGVLGQKSFTSIINPDLFMTRETNQINMTIKNYSLNGGIS